MTSSESAWNMRKSSSGRSSPYASSEAPIEIVVDNAHPPLAAVHSWHIPRPSLIPSDCESDARSQIQRGSTSSQGSSSSTTSTQSGATGSLLLTAANLASLRRETYIKPACEDTLSLASSTHFTVVNGVTRSRGKPLPSCCCKKYRITALVTGMSALFLLAIMAAVLYLEMRWRDMHFT